MQIFLGLSESFIAYETAADGWEACVDYVLCTLINTNEVVLDKSDMTYRKYVRLFSSFFLSFFAVRACSSLLSISTFQLSPWRETNKVIYSSCQCSNIDNNNYYDHDIHHCGVN